MRLQPMCAPCGCFCWELGCSAACLLHKQPIGKPFHELDRASSVVRCSRYAREMIVRLVMRSQTLGLFVRRSMRLMKFSLCALAGILVQLVVELRRGHVSSLAVKARVCRGTCRCRRCGRRRSRPLPLTQVQLTFCGAL